jgi:hypothetical protein
MTCSLVGSPEGDLPPGPLGTALAGTLVSSLHRLKDQHNVDSAFFVFGDLSIKLEGIFRLRFDLYELRGAESWHIQSTQTEPFKSHSAKTFPGMSESTFLTRTFSDQGVRLRLRKEPRALLKKRGPSTDDYRPRQYRNNHIRQQSQGGKERPEPEVQDTARQTQGAEAPESMQLPIHTHQYDPRPPMRSEYTHHSAVSLSGSYSDEGPNKRPRTGSEQSFHSHPLDSPQYPGSGRMFNDSPQYTNPFGPSGTPSFFPAYTHTQSPSSSSMYSREQYFPQRLNSQSDSSPVFDQSQRSPQDPYFPPQPQAVRYTQQSQPLVGAPTIPQRIHGGGAQPYPLGIDTRIAPVMQPPPNITGMPPPVYGRPNPNYGPLTASPVSRRGGEIYGEYAAPNPNAPVATLGGASMVINPSSSSAPPNLESFS